MLFFHPKTDPVHSRPLMFKHSFVAVAIGISVPGWDFHLTLPALHRDTGSFEGQDLPLLCQHNTYSLGPLPRAVKRYVINNQVY